VLKLPKHLHQLSIRHMAVGADGALWFGTQWEGDPLHTPSLVGRASLESGLSLVEIPAPELGAMRGYVGAMAASRDGSMVSASAPRGGLIAYWDALNGRMLGTTPLADSSGIAGGGSRFLASNGAGVIIDADGPGDGHDWVRRPELSFDNHLRTG
jgi:hypothetical protein